MKAPYTTLTISTALLFCMMGDHWAVGLFRGGLLGLGFYIMRAGKLP